MRSTADILQSPSQSKEPPSAFSTASSRLLNLLQAALTTSVERRENTVLALLTNSVLVLLERGLGGRVVSASVCQSAIAQVGRFESRSPLVRATLPTRGGND